MVEATETATVWRVPQPVRAAAVGVFIACVCLALLSTAVGVTVWGALVLWAMVLAVMLGVWRWYLVPYVALTPEHLVVQGAFGYRSVCYDAIDRARPGVLGLRIETSSEGAFTAWAIQKSKLSEWLDRDTPADDLAAQIMRRVDHAS
jgi:hypothetical protein